MAEPLYDTPTAPYLTKNSPYLESANSFMLRVIQHGFIEHWTSKSLLLSKRETFPRDIEKIEKMATPATPLSIGQIVGSLMIYSFGIVISSIVFFAELIKFTVYKRG